MTPDRTNVENRTGYPNVPVVYLDTQDFSRFGDVLRGKEDADTERLFLTIEEKAKSKAAIFPVSMPILSELLQYNSDYRETTMRKAEAVERLCGTWALAFPQRLIAAEIAGFAGSLGEPIKDHRPVLSSDREWFPDISSSLSNFGAELKDSIADEMAKKALVGRKMRRMAKSEIRRLDPAGAMERIAPEIAARYGIPVAAVSGSIVALLRGRISADDASRRLFGAIAHPVTFVEVYFEKVLDNNSELPSWMSSLGERLQNNFVDLRNVLRPLLSLPGAREKTEAMLVDWRATMGTAVLEMAAGATEPFGIDPAMVTRLAAADGFLDKVPSAYIVGRVMTSYVRQIIGLSGKEANVERSFGGDIVHALYLPHVDLWRGDRRFSAVVTNAAPRYAQRVVPLLKNLPEKIDAWHVGARGMG